MRITVLVPRRALDGATRVLGEYAGRLRARNHDVTVVYRRSATDVWRWFGWPFRRRTRDALDECGCPVAGVVAMTPDVVPDGDVILTTGLRTVREAAALPREKGRLVEIVNGTIELAQSPAEAREVMALPVRRVAVSPSVAGFLKEHFGVDASVVPNGVDHAQFYNSDRQFRTPRSVGMIYVDDPMKGNAEGFEAMRRVRDKVPDVRLVLFGARRPRDAPPRVEIYVRPRTSRLRAIYSSCDMWLAPSWSEGFGLPVLEAMACRVVPIATRAGGHVDLVEDGVNGFLVPVGDAEAMADRIGFLLQDESVLRKVSEAAHERSLLFDWDKSAEQLETLLKEWMA